MNAEEQLKNIRTADGKSFYEVQLRRSRITALILASATIISFAFLVYAFVQKEKAAELKAQLVATEQALESCQNAK